MKAAENIAKLYRDDRKKNIFCTSAGNSQTRRKGKEKEKVSDKIGKGKTSAPANGDQLKKTLTQISSWVPNRKLCSTTNF